MQAFIEGLPQTERNTYQKVALISSLADSLFAPSSKFNPASTKHSSKMQSSLSNEDLLNICKYSNPLIAPIPPQIQQKINKQKFGTQQNTCLHIAAQYGNIHLLRHLVRGFNKMVGSDLQPQASTTTSTVKGNKQIDQRNDKLDTPLMHCLKYNSQHKMEKIVSYLSKYSDLSLRDKKNKLCFEIPLPAYNVSKVRILEFLKQKYQSTV